MNPLSKPVLIRFFIVSIVVIIVSIYYFSELKPFEYAGYEKNINQLQRIDAELNEAIVLTRFGILRYYEPIDKAMDGVRSVLLSFKSELASHPQATIEKKLKILEESINRKQQITENFKRINPILMNAIQQFSTILAQIIESQASTQLVESCLEQDYRYQIVDKINNLFREVLIYVNINNETKRQELINLVQDIRRAPQQFSRLDLALSYADKILELQPKVSQIDQILFEVPIVNNLNDLNESYKKAYDAYRLSSHQYRIILYILVFLLLVIIRWAFIKLGETNRQLERRVKDRTKELTVKNDHLNQALLDLKEAQEQLIIQEKMASVGMLTTGIAHEIQNPLNFVNNFSDVSIELLNELNGTLINSKEKLGTQLTLIQDILNDLKTNCAKVKEHGERADNIVKNMLLHSQEVGVQKELVDMESLLKENIHLAVNNFRDKHHNFEVKLEKHFEANIEKILIAPQSIGRVILYIVDNALYALWEKRQSIDHFQPRLTISLQQLKSDVVIKVKDNGIGIEQKNLDKIFQPFFTTKPTRQGNTGLGLSICYDTVVKQHKGQLKVTSEHGVYTEFILTLPINARQPSD